MYNIFMNESNEQHTGFLGTYFDRDVVLRMVRLAGNFAWIVLGIYIFTTLISFTQFMLQFATGIFNQKGILALDLVSYFTPYLIQFVPGLIYFFGLKLAGYSLLILLDIEDNTRRTARKK